jgi:hypothetical protein
MRRAGPGDALQRFDVGAPQGQTTSGSRADAVEG